MGRAPRTKETLPDFVKWRRVTRLPLVFRGLTGSQRTSGFRGVTVMECLEISLPLSIKASPEKYIELTDIIILCIVENNNEYLRFRFNLDPEKTRKVIEKIKLSRNEETSNNN